MNARPFLLGLEKGNMVDDSMLTSPRIIAVDSKDPVGYRISTVDFKNGMPSAAKDSTNAATDIIKNPDLANCPGRCFRPVGLAWDSKGRLWFSSDSTGEIFVLEQNGGKGGKNAGMKLSSSGLAAGLVAAGAALLLA